MSSFNPAPDKARAFEPRPLTAAEAFRPAAGGEPAEPAATEPAPSAEEERQRAWQEGFDAGRAEQAEELEGTLDPTLDALTHSADSLDRQRRQYLAAHREAVVELALVVAERIVGDELSARPERVAQWVEDALAQLEGVEAANPPRVYLAPEDLERVSARRRSEAPPLEWVSDPHLGRGEARVECGASAVRVGLEAGVNEIRRSLREALGGGGER